MDKKSGIVLRNISKVYPGIHALKHVDFDLSPGEIHCLVGENGSGKSTFIKILSGVVKPEPGAEIWIDGELRAHHTSAAALEMGIHVIYQDMSLFPNLSVAENIVFTEEIGARFVTWKKMKVKALQAMEEIGVSLDPDRKVESLSIAQQQLVEITRSLAGNLKLLILDEPTASLTQKEVNALFRTIFKLKERGISILFVSHKMNEIFRISERITVFRDGSKIGVYKPEELDQDKLVFLMSGQKQVLDSPKPVPQENGTVLELRGLCKQANYQAVSFSLRRGEILGITGLLGSGRTELALSIFGMNKPDSGSVFLEGKEVTFASNRAAVSKGVYYVPEDRRNAGLIMKQTIVDNLTVTNLRRFLGRAGLLSERSRYAASREQVKKFEIKISEIEDAVETLSGGNQQKVVLSKWLSVVPKVLILDEPTVGIDVIAKNHIHMLIKSLAEKGMSIILISDEIAEVMRNCHRVLVMQFGRVVYEFYPDREKEEQLLAQFNLG